MAADKATTLQAENPPTSPGHEAVLTGVIALANLFSNCVEAFGLIHPSHKWEKDEQLALCRLGIQQARLLIWGDVTGLSSPPKSVTDRAVPKHPSAAYPDLKEPTFFGPRDVSLDETDTRTQVENALSAIVDRSSTATREEMMEKYGLKPPKRFAAEYQPALDTNRLEAFRERYELLKEVAESYARINTRRRNNSITHTSWTIADYAKFGSFIKLTQEKVDYLINMMDVKERVDRAMRMDIKALGWHLSADRARVAMDVSKLRLIKEACVNEYPEYVPATDQALSNIERERKENMADYNPYASMMASPLNKPASAAKSPRASISQVPEGATNGATSPKKEKRHSIFGGLFKGRGRKSHDLSGARSQSVSAASTGPSAEDDEGPPRALSETGPVRSGSDDSMAPLEPIRSKSVGAILETPAQSLDEQLIKAKLERMNTNATVDEPLDHSEPVNSAISRHDQFQGLGRQGTKDE